MPSALRAQVALLGLLAVLLIPVGTSSLRGLTHVLSCQEPTTTPVSIEVHPDAPPVISSSVVIQREPDGTPAARELCGGLTLDLAVGSSQPELAEITLSITNGTDYGWRGSVQLDLAGTSLPVAVGEIAPGDTVSDTVELHLDADRTYTLEGSLLIGP